MPNAIAYSQFQIAGGLKALFWASLVTAVGVPTLVFVNAQSDPPNATATLASWLNIVLFLQAVLLLVLVPSRIHGAMKRDRQQKLIESHRLMPTSATSAIFGYIVGPNIMLFSVSFLLMAVGMGISVGAGMPVGSWIAQHVVTAFSCAMLCCLFAFFGQAAANVNPALLTPILVPFGLAGMALLPAWQMLMTPLQGGGVWALTASKLDLATLLGISMQLLVGAVLFVGAARRYRRDDRPALGVWWGLALLAIWVGGTLAATRVADDLRVGSPLFRLAPETVTFVASLSASMLLAIGPIASSAFMRIDYTSRLAVDPHIDERKPIGIALAGAMAMLVVLTLLFVSPNEYVRRSFDFTTVSMNVSTHAMTSTHALLTVGVVALFVATMATFTTAIVRLARSPAKWNAIWIGAFWGLGPLLDVAGRAMMGRPRTGTIEDVYPTLLTWLSPPGTLAAIWMDRLGDATAGIAMQGVLLVAVIVLLGITMRKPEVVKTDVAPAV